jgi:hypothetical protein
MTVNAYTKSCVSRVCRQTRTQEHPVRSGPKEDCGGAAEALGGVPRGTEEWSRENCTGAEAVSRGQGEARQKSGQGVGRESGLGGEACGCSGHRRTADRIGITRKSIPVRTCNSVLARRFPDNCCNAFTVTNPCLGIVIHKLAGGNPCLKATTHNGHTRAPSQY